MNRDLMEKTSHSCLLCRSLGYHSYGNGCFYASPPIKKSEEEKNKALLAAIERIEELFKKDKNNENK